MAQTLHPIKSWRDARAESGEVRHRMQLFDRDIRENVARLQNKHSFFANAMRFGYAFTASTDLVTTVPIYNAAKRQALNQGKDYETAKNYANGIVRLVVGSGHPVDLPAVMRSRGATRLFTMYYGYANSQYQGIRLSLNDIQKARLDRAVGRRLPYILAKATALVIGNAIIGEWLASRGPDDDEDKGAWFLRKAPLWALNTIPFARDFARALEGAIEGRGTYSFTPLSKMGERAFIALKDVPDVLSGDEDVSDAIPDFIDAGLMFVPGGQQIDTTGTYIYDLLEGNAEPETFPQFLEDLAYPRPKERR
jgi:hypothetical protein